MPPHSFLHSLAVTVPQSLADAVFEQLPPASLGSSAFKQQANDHGDDPLWVVEALYESPPDTAAFTTALAVLAAAHGLPAFPLAVATIAKKGWLAANQQAFPPIWAGRVVIHGHRDRSVVQPPLCGIEMEASCAFGTGEHASTFGCLLALQGLRRLYNKTGRALDIGTGSAILAIAMHKLLRFRRILATDLDGDSVQVATHNSRKNGAGRFIRCAKAVGFRHAAIKTHRPYALITSNIFARPLARLAPAMRTHLAANGRIILAGFLTTQENTVLRAYATQRLHLEKRLRLGVWTVLVLTKRG